MMMTKTTLSVAAMVTGVLMLAAGPAFAVTVMNKTDKTQEVVMDHGDDEPKARIEAGKSAQVNCAANCELRVVGGQSYGLAVKTGERAVIEKGGMLAYQDGTNAAGAGGAKAPTAN